VGQRGFVGKANLLVGMNAHTRTLASGVSFPFANRDHSCVAARIDVEAVVARFLNSEGQVWRVNFVDFPLKQLTDMQVQRSLMKLDLNAVVTHVRQRKTGFVTQPKNARPDVEFGSRGLVAPDVVGICQRAILRPLNPVAVAGGLNRHRARHILQTHGASGRVAFFRRIFLRPCHNCCQRQHEKHCENHAPETVHGLLPLRALTSEAAARVAQYYQPYEPEFRS
jgi:hypothetical protein